MHPAILIVCGPTASGKSARAQQLAGDLDGVILNTDSMQVYKELHVLTARPSVAEEAACPHRLYGYVSIAEPYSAMRWLNDVKKEIVQCIESGKMPVVVGGTGMYIRALMEGLSPIPDVPPQIREQVKAEYEQLGEVAFRAELAVHDPDIAARLKPNDAQRLKRAMEVFIATEKPLSHWQGLKKEPPLPSARFQVVNLDIPREVLYQRCDARFDVMLEQGAVEEAKFIEKQRFNKDMPGMKAVGLPELLAYLQGTMTLEEAAITAKQMTRHYAKRQYTWIRNQMQERMDVPWDASVSQWAEITEKLRKFIDHTPLNH